MICPVCTTNNIDQDTEYCVQCGSDLKIHHLIKGIRKEMRENTMAASQQQEPKRSMSIFIQILNPIFLLLLFVFSMFVGLRFLGFLDRVELHSTTVSNKWDRIGFEQLQQMNLIIKQELDLIVEQRRENQILQARIQELVDQVAKNKLEVPSPIIIPGGSQ